MPIQFAVKIAQLNLYMTIASPMTLTFIQVRLKLDYFLTCNTLTRFKLLHSNLAWQ